MNYKQYFDIGVITIHGILMGFSFGIILASLPQFVARPRIDGGLHSTNTWFSIIVAIYSGGVAIGALSAGVFQRKLTSRNKSKGHKTTHHLAFLIADTLILIGALIYWMAETSFIIAIGIILILIVIVFF